MISPKQSFQKSPWFREFGTILESEPHRQALFAALLQMQMNSPETTDPVLASMYDQRLIGARHFVRILCGLCDAEVQPKQSSSSANLNHNV